MKERFKNHQKTDGTVSFSVKGQDGVTIFVEINEVKHKLRTIFLYYRKCANRTTNDKWRRLAYVDAVEFFGACKKSNQKRLIARMFQLERLSLRCSEACTTAHRKHFHSWLSIIHQVARPIHTIRCCIANGQWWSPSEFAIGPLFHHQSNWQHSKCFGEWIIQTFRCPTEALLSKPKLLAFILYNLNTYIIHLIY